MCTDVDMEMRPPGTPAVPFVAGLGPAARAGQALSAVPLVEAGADQPFRVPTPLMNEPTAPNRDVRIAELTATLATLMTTLSEKTEAAAAATIEAEKTKALEKQANKAAKKVAKKVERMAERRVLKKVAKKAVIRALQSRYHHQSH